MNVEKTLNGDLLLQMSEREGELLYSFLEYVTRVENDILIVTEEEYGVAEDVCVEISKYIEDSRPTQDDVEALRDILFKCSNDRICDPVEHVTVTTNLE